MMWFRKKGKRKDARFDPDEIFIDSINPSGFDEQQMEGVLEKPLSRTSLTLFRVILLAILLVFLGKSFSLQVINGEEYRTLAERNILRRVPIFADRGVIYDRNGAELAWNTKREGEDVSRRVYRGEAFGHLFGYVRYPQKDSKGKYWSFKTEGEYGVERLYDDTLAGENGSTIVEYDAEGNIVSSNLVSPVQHGKNITLTIDSRVQEVLYDTLRDYIEEHHFEGGGAAIMDVQNGDLLALVSYPSFDSNVMTNERSRAGTYLRNPQKPFFHRVVSGLYPPGSTVKPFIALAALNEHIISPQTTILSTGKIEVENPYNPSKPFIYRDWKRGGHGVTDVKKAIAESVNTFFYIVGGGYKSREGLGIRRIDEYLKQFHLGERTMFPLFTEKEGVIPSPEWKERTFHDSWRLGDTYISAIGQFGFLVSPLQLLRSYSLFANRQFFVSPRLTQPEPVKREVLTGVKREYIDVVREGMRDVVRKGTARNLLIDGVSIAAKTGTAQVGAHNEFYDSWIVGFLPYENPRYLFVLFLEKGKKAYGGAASAAFRDFLIRFQEEYPQLFTEYFAD